ncbi:MAG: tRNA (adenosine(37)-N6)-dimethylallyltransferase MiaA, partial [Bacteroidota bacterium]
MKPKKHLIVVGGPTASGKTKTAIRLAQHHNTVILSADSRQFYREMSIGTAKPDAKELAMARHYFIDSHSINHDYSVGDYEKEALALLEQLFEKHDKVILTGGSGLYINALCQGLDQFPEVSTEIKMRLESAYEKEGLGLLQSMIKEVDPDYAKVVDMQNPHRLLRALSVYEASGQPFSKFLQQAKNKRSFQPIYLQMHWERSALYDRINRRVDIMVKNGLLEEVEALKPYQDKSALATVGYQEIFDYQDGQHDLPTAIDLIKRNSRRYAKRQLTWMRRDGFWKKFSVDQVPSMVEYIDWCIDTNYTLSNEFRDDKTHQLLSFKMGDKQISVLEIVSTKQYDWVQIKAHQDQQALFYALEEWLNQSALKQHYLFSPIPIELFIEELGFHPIDVFSV